MASDHRARRGAVRLRLVAIGLALLFVPATRERAGAQVTGEDLGQAAPVPTPIAPPPAVPPPTAPSEPTLEQQAEEKYAAGDLEGAAALYRQLAVTTSAPQERLRLLVAAA